MRSAILFILLGGCLTAQQSGIEGVAVDAVTRQPMAGVHLTLRPATAEGAGPEDVYGAMSRVDGHFSITGMKPDIYAVTAQRNGYLLVPDRAGTTVTVKAGEPVADFVVRMTRHAVVIGHVLDEFGDPVQHAQIEVSAAGGGVPAGVDTPGFGTDERGQFRLSLPPGKFYIKASAGETSMMRNVPEVRSDGGSTPVYAATYYPATENKNQARVIEAVAGREMTGIDIRLVQKRSLKISGVVTGMSDREAPVTVTFFSGGAENRGGFHISGEAVVAADGRFAIAGLGSGRYRLLATQGESLKSQLADVQLDNADVSGISLALQRGESLAGNLEMEGRLEKLTIQLESEFQTKGGDVDPEGTFRIDQVFPGTYRVSVLPLPENAYIKSVKANDTEADGGLLDLSRGVSGARVKVTVSRNGGQVEGSVLDSDGEPLRSPMAFVMLVSTADDIGKGNFKVVAAGTKFRYSGLRPGKYRLIAADGRDFAGEIENSEAIFAKAPEIEVREGDRITKDVEVLNAP